MEIEWITPKQAAEKWSITERRVEALCANGQIDGVIRMSRIWLIPKNASKPIDGRTKAARQKQTDKEETK